MELIYVNYSKITEKNEVDVKYIAIANANSFQSKN